MQQMQNETMNAAQGFGSTAGEIVAPLVKLHLLYESRDRRMCLFEDAQGHLIAAPSFRLA